MKVTTEDIATKEVELTFEPEPERVQNAMRQAARKLSRARPVRGFRPGRAPYAMVERTFGRELILNQALDDEAEDLYRDALKEAELDAYTQGQLEIASDDPLILKVHVSLTPSVELQDYADVHIEPEPDVAITEEEVEGELQALRRSHAQFTPVERPAAMGDQVVADVTGTAGEQEIVNDERATFDLSDELMPPGFAEALVGMSAEETREFTLAYPESYEDESLAGQTVDYVATVHTVREVELPPLDDDLAKMAGDMETLDELREALADRLTRTREAERRRRESEACIDALVQRATVEYPQAALDQETDQQLQAQAQRAQRMGLPFETYLRISGQTIDQLRDALRPAAERALVERLVIAEYARREGLEVSDDEFRTELNAFAAGVSAAYGDRAQEVLGDMAQSGAMRSVYGDALLRKAVQQLVNTFTGRTNDASDETDAEEDKGEGEEADAEDTGDAQATDDDASTSNDNA